MTISVVNCMFRAWVLDVSMSNYEWLQYLLLMFCSSILSASQTWVNWHTESNCLYCSKHTTSTIWVTYSAVLPESKKDQGLFATFHLTSASLSPVDWQLRAFTALKAIVHPAKKSPWGVLHKGVASLTTGEAGVRMVEDGRWDENGGSQGEIDD